MALVHRLAALVRQATDILPGPPPADDRAGLDAWQELVRRTADRLAALMGVRATCPTTPLPSRKLTVEDLLALLDAGSVEGFAGATASPSAAGRRAGTGRHVHLACPSGATGSPGAARERPAADERAPRTSSAAELVRRRAARRHVRTSATLGSLHCPGASRVG